MLSSIPARLIVRRTRSMSPSKRVFQTNVNAATCQSIRNTQVDTHRNTVMSTSRVSKREILDDKTSNGNSFVQYQKCTHRWLSNLDNRRRSWAALAVRERNNNQYWEESHEKCRAVWAPVGLLTAAAVAFCIRKDSDNKGRQFLHHCRFAFSQCYQVHWLGPLFCRWQFAVSWEKSAV